MVAHDKVVGMTEPHKSAENPFIITLWVVGILLPVVGLFMVASASDLVSNGSNIFTGVTSGDLKAGQVLNTLGTSATTAGLVMIGLALAASAVRWVHVAKSARANW